MEALVSHSTHHKLKRIWDSQAQVELASLRSYRLTIFHFQRCHELQFLISSMSFQTYSSDVELNNTKCWAKLFLIFFCYFYIYISIIAEFELYFISHLSCFGFCFTSYSNCVPKYWAFFSGETRKGNQRPAAQETFFFSSLVNFAIHQRPAQTVFEEGNISTENRSFQFISWTNWIVDLRAFFSRYSSFPSSSTWFRLFWKPSTRQPAQLRHRL